MTPSVEKYLAILVMHMVASTAGAQAAENSTTSPAKLESPALPPRTVGFQPGFDDLMTMLIQPRHIKLYRAGTANNWELAAFELAELRSAFRRAAQAMPRYEENDVVAALHSFIDPTLQALDTAIRSGNAKGFAQKYADLTAACNSCHTFMERPALIIKTPDAAARSAYVDQDFGK